MSASDTPRTQPDIQPYSEPYIVQLHLAGMPVLIVGGGEVAARKATALSRAGAQVTIISPQLLDEHLQQMAQQAKVKWIQAQYHSDHLSEYAPRLVIAATDSEPVNAQVAADAHTAKIWVNRVDHPDDSTFSNMMTVHAPPLQLALSSDGASPALSKRLRDRFGQILQVYQPLARWLGDLRLFVKAHLPADERRTFWRQLTASPILDAVEQSDIAGARAAMQAIVDERFGEGTWELH